MTKPLITALALALCAPAVFAQTPKPEVITHLNDLDVEVSAMGVPTSTTEAGGELVGIRAVRVMNNTGDMVTCEFHVPDDARADTSAPPVFTISPNSQRVERVPGEYSPDEPFAELTCRNAAQRTDESGLPPETAADPLDDAEPAGQPAPASEPGAAPAGEPVDMRARDPSSRAR